MGGIDEVWVNLGGGKLDRYWLSMRFFTLYKNKLHIVHCTTQNTGTFVSTGKGQWHSDF